MTIDSQSTATSKSHPTHATADKLDIRSIAKNAFQEISTAGNLNELKNIEVKYLGKKGQITELLKSLKDLSDEEKRTVGQQIQQLKNDFQQSYQKQENILETAEINQKIATEFFDLSFNEIQPTPPIEPGSLHPLTQITTEVEDIFKIMGFIVEDGPEVESEYYNFEALNIPSHHPARDMQDTFFLKTTQDQKHGHLLLRTHTSPTQARAMEKYGAPLRIIVPGRVFRYEATDATHDTTFNQIEGLLIDEHISLADLKGTLHEFLTRLFKREVEMRLRPGYFPFVEPGVEIDILWKKGQNGEADKWLEVLGAGMVHPNVLRAGGIDPEKYQGWAFGLGITRMAMLKYQIDDIRHFHTNDLRFLKQF